MHPTPAISQRGHAPSRRGRRTAFLALAIAAVLLATLIVSVPVSAAKVYTVPSRIDATGSREVSLELNRFIASVPDGSIIRFRWKGVYRVRQAVRVRGKDRITIRGNGATLQLVGPVSFAGSGLFIEGRSKGVTVRNLKIVGNHKAAGTKNACCSGEGQAGIAIFGSDDTHIENVDIRRVGGDCFLVHAHDKRVWSRKVVVRKSTCVASGRMGAHIAAGENVRFARNRFDKIGYAVFAMEPNRKNHGATNVVILKNRIGSYSLTRNYNGYLLYACDAPWGGGSTIRDVRLVANTVAGNRSGRSGRMMGLNVLVCGDRGIRRDFVVRDNVAKRKVAGPVMRFTRVGGLIVKRNKQPLGSGPLARIQNSWDVDYGR